MKEAELFDLGERNTMFDCDGILERGFIGASESYSGWVKTLFFGNHETVFFVSMLFCRALSA
ncbi:MAG: hypothetical protein NT159_24875 [Proteobacteria bacterium]|nr:hypothetical protein [Pseudomonadota bacterium]